MSHANRRTFLPQSAALGLGIGMHGTLSRTAFTANDRISVARIGVRGRGNSGMHRFAAEVE